jgi:hypothetical protein|tara:strand:- start:241 stop:885 length:645 start_codon:yes stop_codon:yes gene_type:complete
MSSYQLIKDTLYDKDINFQVMMKWEKPYMKKLINNLNPKGDVLEIGFGFGYSADEIQKYNIKSHTIIEPIVFEEAKNWGKKQKHKVKIVKGYWQDVLKKLKTFDTIFFDDAPSKKYEDKNNIRVYQFFYKVLQKHVNKNAVMSWYLDEPIYWLCHPDIEYSIKDFIFKAPKHCQYHKKNIMYLPVIKFKKGIIKDNLSKIALDKYLNIKKLNEF